MPGMAPALAGNTVEIHQNAVDHVDHHFPDIGYVVGNPLQVTCGQKQAESLVDGPGVSIM